MFVRLTYFSLAPEKTAEIVKSYHEEVAPVIKRQPGVVNVLLFEPEHQGDDFISCTCWNTEADVKAFEASSDYPLVFGKIKAATTKAPLQKYYHAE